MPHPRGCDDQRALPASRGPHGHRASWGRDDQRTPPASRGPHGHPPAMVLSPRPRWVGAGPTGGPAWPARGPRPPSPFPRQTSQYTWPQLVRRKHDVRCGGWKQRLQNTQPAMPDPGSALPPQPSPGPCATHAQSGCGLPGLLHLRRHELVIPRLRTGEQRGSRRNPCWTVPTGTGVGLGIRFFSLGLLRLHVQRSNTHTRAGPPSFHPCSPRGLVRGQRVVIHRPWARREA